MLLHLPPIPTYSVYSCTLIFSFHLLLQFSVLLVPSAFIILLSNILSYLILISNFSYFIGFYQQKLPDSSYILVQSLIGKVKKFSFLFFNFVHISSPSSLFLKTSHPLLSLSLILCSFHFFPGYRSYRVISTRLCTQSRFHFFSPIFLSLSLSLSCPFYKNFLCPYFPIPYKLSP